MTTDPLLARLADLVVPEGDSPDLVDRVVTRWARFASPIGDVFVGYGVAGVSLLRLVEPGGERTFAEQIHAMLGRPAQPAERPPTTIADALQRLDGRGLDYDLGGLGSFQRDVLDAAATIPRGETRSYAWIAHEIGSAKAVRAVGTALGHNPVPLLIPCHRVTRADHSVGGYIFGSAVKERLLAVERSAA